MDGQIPIPPSHPAPGAQRYAPAAGDLARDFDRIAINRQQQAYHPNIGVPREAQMGPHPSSAAPVGHVPLRAPHEQAVSETRFEQYTFTKLPMRDSAPVWKHVRRLQDQVSQADMKKRTTNARFPAEKFLNSSEMKGSKRAQVLELIRDRNLEDTDARFEWVVKDIKLETEGGGIFSQPTGYRSMRVIMKRQRCKPTALPRQVRHPNQPYQRRDVVSLDAAAFPQAGIAGRQHGMQQASQMYAARQSSIPAHVRIQQEQFPTEQRPTNAVDRSEMADRQVPQMHPGRHEDTAAARQPRMPDSAEMRSRQPPQMQHERREGGAAARSSRVPDVPNTGKESQGNFRQGKIENPKSERKVHQVFPVSSDEDSSSDLESEALSEDSDGSTAPTTVTDESYNSRRSKKASSGSKGERPSSVKTRRHSNIRVEKEAPTVVRPYERPRREVRPRTRRESIYSSDDVDVRPHPGSGVRRRSSIQSKGSGYSSHRPSYHSRGSGSYDRRYPSGLPGSPRTRVEMGFEQQRPAIEDGREHDLMRSQIQAQVQVELRQEQLRQLERDIQLHQEHARELERHNQMRADFLRRDEEMELGRRYPRRGPHGLY